MRRPEADLLLCAVTGRDFAEPVGLMKRDLEAKFGGRGRQEMQKDAIRVFRGPHIIKNHTFEGNK